MKMTRMLGTAAAAAIVVVGTVPPTSGRLVANFVMFDMGDSPVSVSDGSIHGDINGVDLRQWIEKTANQFYAADAKDIDYLVFEGFSDGSGAAPPSPLQGMGGWLILISNGDPTQAINQDSIAFCSTASNTGCMLGTPDPNEPVKYVYLETSPDANPSPTPGHHGRYGQLKPHSHVFVRRMDFHDNRGGGCDQGRGNCDHILKITVETMNSSGVTRPDGSQVVLPGPNGHTYSCNVLDKCTIKVGQY